MRSTPSPARLCEYCGRPTAWFDAQSSPACRRGQGCARRPESHTRCFVLPSGRKRTRYLHRGEWLSAAQLAARFRLDFRRLLRRLERGWTVREAVRPQLDTIASRARSLGVVPQTLRNRVRAADEPRRAPRGRPARVITAAGESRSIRAWCAALSLSRAALYRLAAREQGSVERAIERVLRDRAARGAPGFDRGSCVVAAVERAGKRSLHRDAAHASELTEPPPRAGERAYGAPTALPRTPPPHEWERRSALGKCSSNSIGNPSQRLLCKRPAE